MLRRIFFLMCCLISVFAFADEAPPPVEEGATQSTPPPAPAVAEPARSTGKVAKAAFTLSVVNHEPEGNLTQVENSNHKVLFFTDLRHFSGQKVRHVWFYNNKQMASVEYTVKGPRWRVWSSKSLIPTWLGKWTVKVMDENNAVVYEQSFEYIKAKEQVESKSEAKPEMDGSNAQAKPDSAKSEPASAEMAPEKTQ